MTEKAGILQVCITGADGIPGNAGQHVVFAVDHGQDEGRTPILHNFGTSGTLNYSFNLEYQDGGPVIFHVYTDTETELAERVVFLDTILDDQMQWVGSVDLQPQGRLNATVCFVEMPQNPPPKATITVVELHSIREGFSLDNAAVAFTLDGENVRETGRITRRGDVLVFNHPEEFDYQNEQSLTFNVLNKQNQPIAQATFDLWFMQRQGSRAVSGDMPLRDGSGQICAKLNIAVMLWDPKEAKPTFVDMDTANKQTPRVDNSDPQTFDPQPPAGTEEPAPPHPVPAAAAPYGGPAGPNSPEGVAAYDLANRAAKDAEIAKEAAKAAAVAASLRPEAARQHARNAADAADEAEKAAEAAAAAITGMNDGTISPTEARNTADENAQRARNAKDIAVEEARRALEAAADDAIAEAFDAAGRAVKAAEASNELSRKNPDDLETADEAVMAAEAADKARSDAEECRKHALEAKRLARSDFSGATDALGAALEALQGADAAVARARQARKRAQEAAKRGAELAARYEKEERRKKKKEEQARKQQNSQEEAALALERQLEAEREAERQREERDGGLHERSVLNQAATYDYHADGLGGDEIMFADGDGLVPPAACCYIPPNRAKLVGDRTKRATAPEYYNQEESIRGARYKYDVTAYGVPDPELDILIEGEMKNPTCCMCCGLRWNKC